MKIAINCETEDELSELIEISERDNNEVWVITHNNLISKNCNKLKIIKIKGSSKKNLISKLFITFQFLYAVYKIKPDILLTGYSFFRHRIYSKISKTTHVSYIRSLIFTHLNNGISNKVYKLIPDIKILKEIFCVYHADKILTTSENNKKYISINKENKIKNIYLTAPIWLNTKPLTINNKKNNKAYILTQAFASHGFITEHEQQIIFIEKINKLYEKDLEIIIRKHPRDYFDYNFDNRTKDLKINTEKSIDFLNNVDTLDLILSPLSSLGFELLYLKKNVIFFIIPGTENIYMPWIKENNIELKEKFGVLWPVINRDVFYAGKILKIRDLINAS